ncbi:plasmid related protein [Stenotrophomonas sp. JAI102]|uniref:plasmid related protein n=1 Tax=Stenotrophomonas sp. JAI102 TaxID=2723077 RepID=UPI0015C7789D|nr:hypothetical protein [Stenotrophomonas sp. JAI102]
MNGLQLVGYASKRAAYVQTRQANRDALELGNRPLSCYQIQPDLKIWLITEADRSVTTILLPNEY